MIKKDIRELLIREEKIRKQIFNPLLSSIGLTPGQGQARILAQLIEQDHITQKKLADICKLDTATMSRNLDRLEAMNLLTRETNPDCRRSYLICLTEKGKMEGQKIQDLYEKFDQMICSGIEENDLFVFSQVLTVMCNNMETHMNEYNESR